MVTIEIVQNELSIYEVDVKDESVAQQVINDTRAAVQGINQPLDVRIKKNVVFNKSEAVAVIMKAVVNHVSITSR